MTGPDDYTNTRPISVAELLAKNGTIGAPPVGGRRRRRRGNADAVTVAELTGEIPIVRPDEPAEPEPEPEPEPEQAAAAEADVDHEASVEQSDDVADAAEVTEADDELVEVEDSDDSGESDATSTDVSDDEDIAEESKDAGAAPRRSPFGRFGRKSAPAVDAELMSPDPVDVDPDGPVDGVVGPADIDDTVSENLEDEAGEADDTALDDADDDDTALDDTALDDADHDTALDNTDHDGTDDDELPSYLRSTQDPLFGGETVADDVARRSGRQQTADPADDLADDLADDEDDDELEPQRQMSPLVHGLWVVGQSVVAVIFGAGLFVAFDQLWKWNNIVALVLSVLVILGLVVGVRVVRKTEDIGSTLIAVAVGALVTLGPLALLQSG
ncbi:hypothetical protein ACXYX3_03135 [Mycobacterium sp. C3-094]